MAETTNSKTSPARHLMRTHELEQVVAALWAKVQELEAGTDPGGEFPAVKAMVQRLVQAVMRDGQGYDGGTNFTWLEADPTIWETSGSINSFIFGDAYNSGTRDVRRVEKMADGSYRSLMDLLTNISDDWWLDQSIGNKPSITGFIGSPAIIEAMTDGGINSILQAIYGSASGADLHASELAAGAIYPRLSALEARVVADVGVNDIVDGPTLFQRIAALEAVVASQQAQIDYLSSHL